MRPATNTSILTTFLNFILEHLTPELSDDEAVRLE